MKLSGLHPQIARAAEADSADDLVADLLDIADKLKKATA
jgi:hypothetical protein